VITVTKPFMPPLDEYVEYLTGIWSRNWITNNGPLVNDLELQLKEKLHLDHLIFVANGTIALQIAIKALGLAGEIITTPYSYVATTSSIVWEGCRPVMADICQRSWNIDPTSIASRITPQTTAILATHVYGNPCDIPALEQIARDHGLKLIFDGAHCFGTQYRGKSLMSYGDISTMSFHATKLFSTGEGGAVVCNTPELLRRAALMRNFGHTAPTEFDGVGINGKNSELHAALGLCNLKYIDRILQDRKNIFENYRKLLSHPDIKYPEIADDTLYNHSYYPVLFKSHRTMQLVEQELLKNQVSTRRYFYPSLSSLDYVPGRFATPIADDIASRVLCLPMYYGLSFAEQRMVTRLVLRVLNNG